MHDEAEVLTGCTSGPCVLLTPQELYAEAKLLKIMDFSLQAKVPACTAAGQYKWYISVTNQL